VGPVTESLRTAAGDYLISSIERKAKDQAICSLHGDRIVTGRYQVPYPFVMRIDWLPAHRILGTSETQLPASDLFPLLPVSEIGMGLIGDRWRGDGGLKQLLDVAIPLILSSGSYSVMMFVDRMFLSWHSEDAIAASVPASMANFSFSCLFYGTVIYTSTFVAQYFGAGQRDRIGATIWQGLRLALIGGVTMPFLGLVAPDLFALVGHDPQIQVLEVAYFRILNFAAGFWFFTSAFSCFFSGRGKTWPVMWMSVLMATLNGFLDYGLVLGNFGLPRLGIRGAGYATLISAAVGAIVYGLLVCRPANDQVFATCRNWRFDKGLFLRIVRFGAPSGLQFWLAITGFTVFILLVGRIGKLELVASNMAHQVNILGILPMVGIGIATSILVGRFQGADKSELAVRSTVSALSLGLAYSLGMALLYLGVPRLLLWPFTAGQAEAATPAVLDLAVGILCFFAVITVIDSVIIVLAGTLKGAGDTCFVMYTNAITSAFCLILPTYVVIEILNLSVYAAFVVVTAYYAVIATVFLTRFRHEKWKAIRVIEKEGRR
jgi:MATE family multidrug resistance protein